MMAIPNDQGCHNNAIRLRLPHNTTGVSTKVGTANRTTVKATGLNAVKWVYTPIRDHTAVANTIKPMAIVAFSIANTLSH